MTIASEITRINNNIASAYTAVNNKGGTLPAIQNSANLATAIGSIPSGGGGASQKYNFVILEDTNVSNIPVVSLLSRNVSFSSSGLQYAINGYFTSGNSVGFTQDTISSSITLANQGNNQISEIHFQALKSISASQTFYSVFKGCTNLITADFSGLETVGSSLSIFRQCFMGCSSLTNVDFSNLVSFSGANNSGQIFDGCSSLTTLSFNKMTDIYFVGSTSTGPFNGTALANIYFPAVKTTSTFSMNRMFTGVSNCTAHFPSNLQTIISGTTGYPTYNGTNITLAFDLPATS